MREAKVSQQECTATNGSMAKYTKLRNNKLVVTSATLLVTGALLVGARSY